MKSRGQTRHAPLPSLKAISSRVRPRIFWFSFLLSHFSHHHCDCRDVATVRANLIKQTNKQSSSDSSNNNNNENNNYENNDNNRRTRMIRVLFFVVADPLPSHTHISTPTPRCNGFYPINNFGRVMSLNCIVCVFIYSKKECRRKFVLCFVLFDKKQKTFFLTFCAFSLPHVKTPFAALDGAHYFMLGEE